ncbi:MAG TPA: hypothetical protein VJ044_15250 [Candidatus Hodarchaeales archaeon]|nr:hypothetical protein [Candidatus Hodarchaeales archaeon]
MNRSQVSPPNYIRLVLSKYEAKEITLRTLARALDISLWEVQELLNHVPYEHQDLQRDLRLIAL